MIRRLRRGKVQAGVRWKTSSRFTRGWISGMSWAAEQPVPITATRSPARSCAWSQRAEWKQAPPKLSSPGMAGSVGWLSGPMPEIRNWASRSPAVVSIYQRWRASSQTAPVTSWSKRMRGVTSCWSAQRRMYAQISSCGE